MKQTLWRLFSAPLTLLFLAGCANEQSSSNLTAHSSVDLITTATTVSTTYETIITTANSDSQPSVTTTSSAAEETTTETTTVSTAETTTVRFPAESDDYGNSGTPHPLNFSYHFTAEGVALRIEGGNYQTLHYPLSTEAVETLPQSYIISDCNFDGHYDLLLPVYSGAASVTYALFLWDEDTLRYHANAIELVNPVFVTEYQEVHCFLRGSAVEYSYEIYCWNNDNLHLKVLFIADFSQLTMTSLSYDNGALVSRNTNSYDDAASLQAALDTLSQ